MVAVLKNENRKIRLTVTELANGKSRTIIDGIKAMLDEYDLWTSIKMIVSETTAANTGKCVGAGTRLQNHFEDFGQKKLNLLEPTPYFGHNIETCFK